MDYAIPLLIVAFAVIIILIVAVLYLASNFVDELERTKSRPITKPSIQRIETIKVEKIQHFLNYCDLCIEQLQSFQTTSDDHNSKLLSIEKLKVYLATQRVEFVNVLKLQGSFLYLIPAIENTVQRTIDACNATIAVLKESNHE